MEIPNRNLDSNNKKKNPYMYPLVIIIALIPLIVHQKICDTNLEELAWYSSETQINDFFLYYKSVALVLLTIVMAAILIFNAGKIKKKAEFPIFIIPLGIYGLMVILSMLFSENRELSLNGSIEQYESGVILLGYVIFAYYAYAMITSVQDVEFLIRCWAISMGVLSILGLTQVLNHDFFATNIGKHLITMKEYWGNLDSISFTMGAKRIYLTLYNPNYVGVYASLAIPVLAMLLIFTANKVWKAIYGVLILGMLICIVGSASKSAFFALAVVMILFLVFVRKKLLEHWKISGAFVIALVAVFFIFDANTGHLYTNSLKNAIQAFSVKTEHPLKSIKTEKEKVVINWNGNILNISCDPETYMVYVEDQEGMPVAAETGEQNLQTITDERFAGITVMPVMLGEQFAIQVAVAGDNWYFAQILKDEVKSYYFYNWYGKWDKIAQPDVANIPENILSNRGFIWSRTIPLLKKYVIVGSGPDTFVQTFPGNDYVGMFNAGYKGSLMTKPHNMYLQIGVQTGVISLLAFLAFYIIYFVQSLRIYIKNNLSTKEAQIGAAIFLGSIGYMIAGISNDSTITVSPIFWVLIGIGFWLNKRAKELVDAEKVK